MITAKINNFSENELKCRCCGLLNMSDDYLIRLQAFRSAILKKPLTVTSSCRCKKHNKEVGGEPKSCHLGEGKKCTAADVTNSNCAEIYSLACKSGLFNEVIFYKNQYFVHLGYDPNQKGNYFVEKK